ncbi:hypothetical protein Poly51_63620 [Rubripirellula tenax]|uniref:Uncharacterized protein n=1 Tax=Rubripirellula tenax TaxID=2528015 RepID=A0A5C6E1Y1_9BACT|nr:hypothetical protein Poly51_63620 [Rubripirellula tenax]
MLKRVESAYGLDCWMSHQIQPIRSTNQSLPSIIDVNPVSVAVRLNVARPAMNAIAPKLVMVDRTPMTRGCGLFRAQFDG